jgi:hypothetical protein
VTRFVDRGAVFGAYVGIGMAAVIAVSFLLVIPIEPVYWLLAPLSGLLIGYYANGRSNREAGQWRRTLSNGLFAGAVTGLSLAAFLLLIKALFFFADTGYPDFNRVDPTSGQQLPPSCANGAGCVYARYLAQEGGAARLGSAGITDVGSFTSFYWTQQGATAATILAITIVGGVAGAAAYGASRPRGAKVGAVATGER